MSRPGANLQTATPSPYWGRSLWRGCKWAVNMGPWHGREQTGPYTCKDSRDKNYGRYTGGVGGLMSNVRNGGRFLNSSGGASGLEWLDHQWNAIPQLGIFEWQDTGGMSLACTFRFYAIPAGNSRLLTKRFSTGAFHHCAALSFSVATGVFEYSYCNGIGGVQSILGTLVPVVGVTYTIVGKHWGNNALSRAELWVNGKREAVNAAPATYPAYKKDPPLIYYRDTGSGDPSTNGETSMGGLWNRPITTAEIKQLAANPYIMWGPPAGPSGLPFAGAGGVFACRCCPGWLVNWTDM